MAIAKPDWLTRRGGDLRLGSDGATWFVYFGADPDYSLRVVPVGGKFSCVVRQTNNGQQLEISETFASADESIKGGLERLRKELGWE